MSSNKTMDVSRFDINKDGDYGIIATTPKNMSYFIKSILTSLPDSQNKDTLIQFMKNISLFFIVPKNVLEVVLLLEEHKIAMTIVHLDYLIRLITPCTLYLEKDDVMLYVILKFNGYEETAQEFRLLNGTPEDDKVSEKIDMLCRITQLKFVEVLNDYEDDLLHRLSNLHQYTSDKDEITKIENSIELMVLRSTLNDNTDDTTNYEEVKRVVSLEAEIAQLQLLVDSF
ncbi:MAG: hypothetical protein EOP45_20650 [Sphingobacteriaceae bacterium]|nr:MAG: hypothetical protein EOP45_20650 [Sphingobacteriaceae bacterium]